MPYKRLVLTLVAFHAAFILMAQAVLTKEKAIAKTLENNLGIKIVQNNARIAANNASVLNSGYLPRLTGIAGGSINRDNTEGQLANGDVRSADGAETRRYNASINLDYTLFDGLGRYYSYKRLQEEYDLSELQARETIETTLLQLFSVYYEVARQEENAHTLQQALQISKQREQRARYQFEYGQNTGLDVLNAEVDVNTDSINLLNAQQLLRNTKRDLNLLMNTGLEDQFQVDTLVTFLPEMVMQTYMDEVEQNNVTLLALEKDMKIADLAIRSAKGSLLPTIGLTGSYGWNESNNNSPLAFLIQNTATGISGGINLTWNLFDGGTALNTIKNVRIGLENQELQQQQTKLQVKRDIANAWDAYENARYVLQVQEKNLQTNQNNFWRTNERFKLGQVTSIEFRQAQLNLLDAKLAQSQAKYTAKLAELQLLQVSGQLLNTDF